MFGRPMARSLPLHPFLFLAVVVYGEPLRRKVLHFRDQSGVGDKLDEQSHVKRPRHVEESADRVFPVIRVLKAGNYALRFA